MELFDFWNLAAGLGIFLFGIYLMEEAIKALAGRAFKGAVRRYTNTRLRAILTGMSTTALLQSSSAITLMILAFVGAGIMSLENAIGVVLGSNIGTTVTAWIVAFFGFKVSIESFALPMIALGGIGMIFFSNTPRFFNLCRLLIGFGFLFHGLDYMKGAVTELAGLLDLNALPGLALWIFVLAGVLLTALMQSSSATIAVVLTAISAGLIGLKAGAAVVIGANIGTTVTVILGALGGVPIKKRVAYGHLIFNLVTAAAALLLLSSLVWFIEAGLGWDRQPVMGIALFHTLFNLLGVVLFLPVIPKLSGVVTRLFPEPDRMFTHYIQNTSPAVAVAALAAFNKEVIHQYKELRNYLVMLYELEGCRPLGHTTPSPADQTFTGSASEFYLRLRELHGEIFDYYARITAGELESDEFKILDRYLRSSRSIMNAARNLKEIRADLEEFELSDSRFLRNSKDVFRARLKELITRLDPLFEPAADSAFPAETTGMLDAAFEQVEAEDRGYIREGSEAIRRGELGDLQTTTMLMANRLFTQSCRMILFSLRELLTGDDSEEAKVAMTTAVAGEESISRN